MQLDVEVSTLAKDSMICNKPRLAHRLTDLQLNGFRDMIFCLMTFCLVRILVQLDRHLDRQTESDAYEPAVHMHRRAQICTGVLKN